MFDTFHAFLREMVLSETIEKLLRVRDDATQVVLIVGEVHLVETDDRLRDGLKLPLELLDDGELVLREESVTVEESDFHDDFNNVLHNFLRVFLALEVEFGDAVAVVDDLRGGSVDDLFGESLGGHLGGEFALDTNSKGLGRYLLFFTHFLRHFLGHCGDPAPISLSVTRMSAHLFIILLLLVLVVNVSTFS